MIWNSNSSDMLLEFLLFLNSGGTMSNLCLKAIAALSMLIDHALTAGVITQPLLMEIFHLSLAKSYKLRLVLELFGRVAFPIFSFLIAEGCRKTRSVPSYLIRLLLFAILSEVPFDLVTLPLDSHHVMQNILRFRHWNVLFTYALGVACIWVVQSWSGLPKRYRYGVMAGTALISVLLDTDYSCYGILMILIAYYTERKAAAFRQMAAVLFCAYVLMPLVLNGVFSLDRFHLWGASLLGLIAAFSYNGSYGNKRLGILFYYFYPTHLTILAILRILKCIR